MKHLFIALSFTLLFSQHSAVAQEGDVSASHLLAAQELAELLDLEGQMLSGASVMINTMTRQNPQLVQFEDVILEWAESFMTWEVFGPKIVAIYADAFTEEELRELIRFYKTPAGQKTLQVMPDLMSQGAQLGMIEAQARQEDLQQRIKKRAEEIASGD